MKVGQEHCPWDWQSGAWQVRVTFLFFLVLKQYNSAFHYNQTCTAVDLSVFDISNVLGIRANIV